MAKLFLIDGHALAYRMFFAFQKQNLTAEGKPTGAVYGFTTTILRLLENYNPDYFAVVFDPSGPTFRNDLYQDYKATRQKMPEELRVQLPEIGNVLSAMNCPAIEVKGFEADDVIGTLAKRCELQGVEVYIYTGDKDFMQLISDKVFMLKPGLRGKDDETIGADQVIDKFGVPPDKVIDALALIGDTSDNVPGVLGVGEKSAADLIMKYGSLDTLLAEPGKISHKRAKEFLSDPLNVEMIRLSRKLVTIDTQVPLPVDLIDLQRKSFDRSALYALFKRLQFRSLLANFVPQTEDLFAHQQEKPPQARYHLIKTMEQFTQLITRLKQAKVFAFDLETTHQEAMRAQVVGVSFATSTGEAWYMPVGHIQPQSSGEDDQGQPLNLPAEPVWSALKPILENSAIGKIAHNFKYDALVLFNTLGIEVQPYYFDTMVADWLVDPIRRQHGLKDLALELLNHKMTTYEEVTGKGKSQINFAEVPLDQAAQYAAEDSDYTLRLMEHLQPQLNTMALNDLFHQIEMPMVEVLTRMEYYGVSIDTNFFNQMSHELEQKLSVLEKQIYHLADQEFNINSPKQLREIFFDRLKLPVVKKTPKGEPSTDADVLEELAREHDLPAKILDFRELAKLKGTYVDALPKMIVPQTGRIHTSYNQTVTPTGRLSSSEPNLQNIPVRTESGKEIRKGFIPGPGFDYLLAADYSQIELRILAHYAGDLALKSAFEKGEDIHARTAAAVFDCKLDEVTPEMRRTAKTTNFGIIYGQTPFGLSSALGISVGEARMFIDKYFATYPGVRNYIEQTIEQARDDGFVSTLKGRRRPLPDIQSKVRNVREYAERTAINTPIQGTAADMIKIAMINIHREMSRLKLKSRMVLQVHDELIFEVVESELEQLTRLVKDKMENALPLSVPIQISTGLGKNWFEAH